LVRNGRRPGSRIAAGLGGAVAAIAFGVATVGLAVVSAIATIIAWAVARRRRSELTRGKSWLIAVGTVGVVLLAAAGILTARAPSTFFSDVSKAMDSTSKTPPPPPPEWLRRITPPAAQVQSRATDKLVRSRAFTMWVTVMSIVFGIGLVAALTGSLGWVAAALILYGATGRWLPSAPPVGPPPPLGRTANADLADRAGER
jgi:hypothetical protein